MRHDERIFALGFFDGVHLGHQALLRACVALAQEMDCETAAITFERHPQSLFSHSIPPLITTLDDRYRLLLRSGVEHVYTFPVTESVMSTPWQAFLEDLIACGAVGFVCGEDFRFGYRGEGDAQKLTAFCKERGLRCIIVPEQALDGRRVSSTHIRFLLTRGDMEAAAKFLGHPHILTETVVPGKKLGRTMGIPTANLHLPEGVLVPKFGVYACRCSIDGKKYPAVTNVGIRPTVSGSGITVEPWILDFADDIYGKEITLEFHAFLRPEQKFDSLEELKAEILKNADETRNICEKV